VKKAVHAFLVFAPLFRALEGPGPYLFYQFLACDEKTDFVKWYDEMGRSKSDCIFAVFLPELLAPEQLVSFRSALASRFSPIPDPRQKKLLIVTTLRLGGDEGYVTEFNVEIVKKLMAMAAETAQTEFFLVRSVVPGSGKSRLIRDLIGARSSTSYFINENHQELPPRNEVIHFQFSDEMRAKGIRFWESLFFTTFFGFFLSDSGRPHFPYIGSTIYFECPDGANFPMTDFPCPIRNDSRHFITIDASFTVENLPDFQPIPRILHVAENCPFVRGVRAVEGVLGLQWDSIDSYFFSVYPLLFGQPLLQEITPRDFWSVKIYLSKFTKLYLKSYPNVSNPDLAVFFLLLTVSSCFLYPNLQPCDYGFSVMIVTNLFCPIGDHNAFFMTTFSRDEIFKDARLKSLRLDRPGLEIHDSLTKDRPQKWDFVRTIFSSTETYCRLFDQKFKSSHTINTWSYLYHLVLVTSRIFLRQSVILEGETGCGKTSLIQFIRAALRIPWNADGHKLTHILAETLDVHGGIGRERFLEYIEEISINDRPTIGFCDEINTSTDCSFVEHHMLDEIPGVTAKISLIAAVNLLAPLQMELKYRVGMEQPKPERLARFNLQEPPTRAIPRQSSRYNVHKLQQSSEQLRVNCNPRLLQSTEAQLYGDEEKSTIEK
jgi:hypothetical protein